VAAKFASDADWVRRAAESAGYADGTTSGTATLSTKSSWSSLLMTGTGCRASCAAACCSNPLIAPFWIAFIEVALITSASPNSPWLAAVRSTSTSL